MSELANRARQRNYLKLRLIGCWNLFHNKNVTPEEKIIMDRILLDISFLLQLFTSNSIKLGFKAYNRCSYCKKKGVNEVLIHGHRRYLCNNHKNLPVSVDMI